MSAYNIPLRIKLSNKEYDKIKKENNKSAYVRRAINFYNSKQALEIEMSKKKLLKDIMFKVQEENNKIYEELMHKEKLKEKRIMDILTKQYNECEDRLLILEEESNSENLTFETCDEQTDEEKILSILPTLQGMFHADYGITYESLRRMAVKIGVSTKILKDWVDNNPDLLNKKDYLYRAHLTNQDKVKLHKFSHDG